MCNFLMKPCIPDGDQSKEIARRIRRRSLKSENSLESLLKMKFTDTVVPDNIKSIRDFPQLSLKQLKNRITLGSYKLRLCKSYVEHITTNGNIYVLTDIQINRYLNNRKVIRKLKNSKILAVLLPSRHSHSKKKIPQPKNANQKKRKYNKKQLDPTDAKSYNKYYKIFINYEPSSTSEKISKPYRLIKGNLIFYIYKNTIRFIIFKVLFAAVFLANK